MEFASVEISCETVGCPNYGVAADTMLRLTEDGQLPHFVCGVCGIDLIADPKAMVENPEEITDETA
jgi:hypothetical protein